MALLVATGQATACSNSSYDRIDWETTNNGIAAWATVAATVTAIVIGLYSARQANSNLALQHRLDRFRVEEQYLRGAIVLANDCYRAAVIYVTSLERFYSDSPDDSALKRQIGSKFLDSWIEFERQLLATIAVVDSSEESAGEIAPALRSVYDTSAALFDCLMNRKPVPYLSEQQLEQSPEAVAVAEAARRATTLISERLLHLRRPVA